MGTGKRETPARVSPRLSKMPEGEAKLYQATTLLCQSSCMFIQYWVQFMFRMAEAVSQRGTSQGTRLNGLRRPGHCPVEDHHDHQGHLLKCRWREQAHDMA